MLKYLNKEVVFMGNVYQLVKTVNVPGSSYDRILKTFSTRDKAINWLKNSQYKKVGKNLWENQGDQDFFAWVYVKIKSREIE